MCVVEAKLLPPLLISHAEGRVIGEKCALFWQNDIDLRTQMQHVGQIAYFDIEVNLINRCIICVSYIFDILHLGSYTLCNHIIRSVEVSDFDIPFEQANVE